MDSPTHLMLLERKEAPVIVQSFENERLAIADVRSPDTRFDDIPAMAEHWATFIALGAQQSIKQVSKFPAKDAQ
jgi:hypothetical protein